MAERVTSQDAFVVPTPHMSPDEWIDLHERAHKYFWGPVDTRIPSLD